MKTRYIIPLIAIFIYSFVSLCAHAAADLTATKKLLETRKADLEFYQKAKADTERYLDPENNYFFFIRSGEKSEIGPVR